jgi:hypothetical protein
MKHNPVSFSLAGFLFLFLFSAARPEVIPLERRIQWSPGIPGGASVRLFTGRVPQSLQRRGQHRRGIGFGHLLFSPRSGWNRIEDEVHGIEINKTRSFIQSTEETP